MQCIRCQKLGQTVVDSRELNVLLVWRGCADAVRVPGICFLIDGVLPEIIKENRMGLYVALEVLARALYAPSAYRSAFSSR